MKTKLLAGLAGLAGLLGAGAAHAAVIYSFQSNQGGFEVTFQEFISGTKATSRATLKNCYARIGTCMSAQTFKSSGDAPDVLRFWYQSHYPSIDDYIAEFEFIDGAFAHAGVYQSLSYKSFDPNMPASDTAKLTVRDTSAAVPEPAGWALMILGFGAAGAMLRRRTGAGLSNTPTTIAG